MNENYEWMELYEAAVLESNPNILPGRIEDAKYAIGQRVIKGAIDEAERRAVVKTLNALCPARTPFQEPTLLSVQRHARSRNSDERQDILSKDRCRRNLHITSHKMRG